MPHNRRFANLQGIFSRSFSEESADGGGYFDILLGGRTDNQPQVFHPSASPNSSTPGQSTGSSNGATNGMQDDDRPHIHTMRGIRVACHDIQLAVRPQPAQKAAVPADSDIYESEQTEHSAVPEANLLDLTGPDQTPDHMSPHVLDLNS